MFDYGVGVSTANSYIVKRIDSDFFEDDSANEMIPETK
jgi:restriction endonuclease Mrr